MVMERGFSLRNGGTELGAFAKGVRAIPASARIHAAMREQIIGMEIPPGAALQEKQIALACGVSRTPVREALLKLADERLVDIFPQYGTFVSRISIPAMRDAMMIRVALERAAVRAAAAAVAQDAALIEVLRRLLAEQRAAHDAGLIATFFAADEAFHQAIAEIAGHPNLWRVVRQEKAHVDRCRILTLPVPGRRLFVMSDHSAIIEAIAAGDPDAAEAAMQAHLDQVLPTVSALVEARPDYFEAVGAPPLHRPHPAEPPDATRTPRAPAVHAQADTAAPALIPSVDDAADAPRPHRLPSTKPSRKRT